MKAEIQRLGNELPDTALDAITFSATETSMLTEVGTMVVNDRPFKVKVHHLTLQFYVEVDKQSVTAESGAKLREKIQSVLGPHEIPKGPDQR